MNMRTENWCGYDIRFIGINGEWWAILKDICDALRLRTDKIASRLDPSMLERVKVEAKDSTTLQRWLNISDPSSNGDRSNIVSNDLRSDIPSKDVRYEHQPVKAVNNAMIGKDIGRKPGEWKTHWMLAVNELGIYEALFASRKLEARKFRMWAGTVMQKLRSSVGLQQYEVMKMTEPDIQEQIDWVLDSLYWDEKRNCVMQSVTVQGGDVEQVPFEG